MFTMFYFLGVIVVSLLRIVGIAFGFVIDLISACRR